jgi:pimeloyl-ACP methyl ester carboxylesterase
MTDLSYTKKGNGYAVVLLHGFPFNQTIWTGFSDKLAESHLVFTVDLPGFGGSAALKSPFSIDDVADKILQWLNKINLKKSLIIGHSLGGYVALALVKKAPHLFNSLCLFHSTAYADSEEKKQSRNKVLEFVDKNGAIAFSSNFISTLFSDQQHPAIPAVRKISMSASAEAIKGYTIAMRDRSERTDVLKNFSKPILFITGDKDLGIPVDSIHRQAALSLLTQTVVLSGVAHMGMFESENQCLETISSFVKENSVTK